MPPRPSRSPSTYRPWRRGIGDVDGRPPPIAVEIPATATRASASNVPALTDRTSTCLMRVTGCQDRPPHGVQLGLSPLAGAVRPASGLWSPADVQDAECRESARVRAGDLQGS